MRDIRWGQSCLAILCLAGDVLRGVCAPQHRILAPGFSGVHILAERVASRLGPGGGGLCRILSARVSEVARQPIRSLARKDGRSFFPFFLA